MRRSEGDISPTKSDHKLKKMSLTRPNIQLSSPGSPVEAKEIAVKPTISDKVGQECMNLGPWSGKESKGYSANNGRCIKIPNTSYLPDRLRQAVQIQTRLKKQSDQDLLCYLTSLCEFQL